MMGETLHGKIAAFKNIFRTTYYKNIVGSWGERSRVLGSIRILFPSRLYIGSNCTINEGCFLNAQGGVTIGDNVHLSPGVIINSGQINLSKFNKKKHESKPVSIGKGSWVASGAIINPGVNIGKGCVVASGSVVTRDVDDGSVVMGVPAKRTKGVCDYR